MAAGKLFRFLCEVRLSALGLLPARRSAVTGNGEASRRWRDEIRQWEESDPQRRRHVEDVDRLVRAQLGCSGCRQDRRHHPMDH